MSAAQAERYTTYAKGVKANIDATLGMLKNVRYQKQYKGLITFLYQKCEHAPARMLKLTTKLKEYFNSNGNAAHFFQALQKMKGGKTMSDKYEAWYDQMQRSYSENATSYRSPMPPEMVDEERFHRSPDDRVSCPHGLRVGCLEDKLQTRVRQTRARRH